MDYKVFAPKRSVCEVALPASKSISNRVLILNALAQRPARLTNIAHCDDTDAMVAALSRSDAPQVNIGAAGTAMRFLTAFLAVQQGRTVVIDGSPRMRQRPIGVLVDALRACGARISYLMEEGFPPLSITGSLLHAPSIEISGSVSSQFISAILMIAPLIDGLTTIVLKGDIISRPYIMMTLELMSRFGVNTRFNGSTIHIGQGAKYTATDFAVESDWSAASYWFEMQALMPESRISLKGLLPQSVQGDAAIAGFFRQMGVSANRCGTYLDLCASSSSDGLLELDLADNPDLAQTLVVTACLLNRHFCFHGLQTLKIKETDRIEALCSQLLKLGYILDVAPDFSLSWNGATTTPAREIAIDTFADHRMAMAFAPAATRFQGIIIKDIDVVKKSYPDFWTHLLAGGFRLEEV